MRGLTFKIFCNLSRYSKILRLHAVEAKTWLSQKYWKKWNNSITFRTNFFETWQAPFYGRVQLNIMLYEIQCIHSWVVVITKCLFCIDIHFPRMVKSCLRHPKTCKSTKITSLKSLWKIYGHLIHIEEIKTSITALPSKWHPHNSYHCLFFYCQCLTYKVW